MVSEQTEPLRPDSARGVYGISIAADLAGVGVQTLRLYERHGLLTPARSEGGTRRYSDDDLTRLRRITTLAAAGVNLAGIGRILDLEDTVAELHAVNARLRKTYPGRSRKTEI
ncbi:MerR family transcriptional regulator [Nocardia brevicatena]|uniref:MerR family transcriptional regulator n=1 Tax=Nocardia brevicatena TaxID=37327 RepID=UPI0002EE97B6|nr:MerR family transcriptional regulator [Nocardia brevicatena]